MTTLHLVQLHNVSILQQLRWEEALLRADSRNWCLINHGSPPAIVMGISGKLNELINFSCFMQSPLPIIRRFTGGGTVVVDHNTFFVTFIFNNSSVSFPPFPKNILEWSASFYHSLFQSLPFHLRENDYVIGNKKMGGNAQSITRNRWVHHSSFLWDYSNQLMDYLLLPSKQPHYREMRGHTDFLCRLKDYWECLNSFQNCLHQHLKNSFFITEHSQEELIQAASLPHRQATIIVDPLF